MLLVLPAEPTHRRCIARCVPSRPRGRVGRGSAPIGWCILDTAGGYPPLDGTAAPRPEHPTGDDFFVRVERRALRRFAHLDAIPDDVRGDKDISDTMRSHVRDLGG